MALVLRETARGKTIANCLLGSVAGFSDLLTEIRRKGRSRAGLKGFDLEPLALNFLVLGRHFPVPGALT